MSAATVGFLRKKPSFFENGFSSHAIIHGVNAHRLHCQEASMGAWWPGGIWIVFYHMDASPPDCIHGNPSLVLPLFNTTILLLVATHTCIF